MTSATVCGPVQAPDINDSFLAVVGLNHVTAGHAQGGKACLYKHFGGAKVLFCYINLQVADSVGGNHAKFFTLGGGQCPLVSPAGTCLIRLQRLLAAMVWGVDLRLTVPTLKVVDLSITISYVFSVPFVLFKVQWLLKSIRKRFCKNRKRVFMKI